MSVPTLPEKLVRDTVIVPPTGWHMPRWRELWAYRELLVTFTARDIKVRYKQTVLGAGWALFRPLVQMVVFSAIFGGLAKLPSDGISYPIFSLTGLLAWTFFATTVTAGGQSLVTAGNMLRKVYFPRLIVPLSIFGVALIDLLVSFAVLIPLMFWYQVVPGWNLVYLPLVLLLLVAASLGPAIVLSALTVAYRDFSHLTPFLVQIGIYLTPVVYPLSLLPDGLKPLMLLNPMAGVVEGFRAVFLGLPMPWLALGVSAVVSFLLALAALLYFEHSERRFADVV